MPAVAVDGVGAVEAEALPVAGELIGRGRAVAVVLAPRDVGPLEVAGGGGVLRAEVAAIGDELSRKVAGGLEAGGGGLDEDGQVEAAALE